LERRDGTDVAREGEQPAREDIRTTHAEAALRRIAFHRSAQAGRGQRLGGGTNDLDDDLVVLRVVELPRVARAGMVAEVESGGDLVVRRVLLRGIDLDYRQPRHPDQCPLRKKRP